VGDHAGVDELRDLGELCRQVCEAVGVVPPRLDEVRRGHWLGIPAGELWLRVGHAGQRDEAERERAAAVGFGALAAGPSTGLVEGDGWVAVGYERLRPVRPTGWSDVGEAVGALAGLPAGAVPFPVRQADQIEWWALDGVAAGLLSAGEADELRGRAEAAAAEGPGPLGEGPAHYDAHPGNVVVTADGPRFVDLETAGRGRRVMDLAVALVEQRRFGATGAFGAAVDAYRRVTAGSGAVGRAVGADPTALPGLAAAALCYEVYAVLWCVEHARLGHDRGEARLRVEGLLRGRPGRWTRQ